MKSANILILAAALALFAPRAAAQGTAAYSPLHVIEGARGQAVTYDPAGGPLANETDIKCVLYIYRNYYWQATDVELRQVEGKWAGTFDVPADAALLNAKFCAGGKTDWGWPATFATFVLDKNRRNKEGARTAWALLRTSGSPLTLPGMCEDSTAAPIAGDVQLMWFNNEFQQFPHAQPHVFGQLVATLGRVKPGEKNDQLRSNIDRFLKDKTLRLTDQQWADIYDAARLTLSDSALAGRVLRREQKEFPHGILSRDIELLRIQNLFGSVKTRQPDDPTAAQAQREFAKFLKRYPTGRFLDAHTQTADLFYSKLFRSAIYDRIMRADDYGNLRRYIHDIPYEELTTTHWHIVEVCLNNGQVSAEKLLPHSQLITDEMLTRPQNSHAMQLYSPEEWKTERIRRNHMALYAHARVLSAAGRYDEAMRYMEMTAPRYATRTAEYDNTYVHLLLHTGREAEAAPYIERCVPNDAVTQEMLDILRRDYLARDPQGDFDTYVASLKNADKTARARAAAVAEMTDKPIALCRLDRMGGGTVDLAQRKGKIMFLDFWATWCAPCKASMPGGKMAADRWKDDPGVEFYFIDTEETDADYRQKAEAFIKSKGYDFTVLFDEGQPGAQDKLYKQVCAALHTSGIPLKLIIDGNGRLRWMKCGYNGSPTGMADEIGYVIEQLKSEQR